MKLEERSLKRLEGVHPDLVAVVVLAAELSTVEFIVTEGLRSEERQRELFLAHKSKTMNSRHLTGHAVDLACWEDRDEDRVVDVNEISWKFSKYREIAKVMKEAAASLGISIVWGGDWYTFKDGPHFELDRRVYS